ncbi:unnamed protein product [Cunninghamella blakesleeana]
MTVCDKRESYFAAQTAFLQYNPRLAVKLHKASSQETSIVLHGSKKSKITIGRGHKNGVLVGRNNPRMSRQHLVIEHKPHTGFILTIQSPNGALVDHIMFTAGEHVPLVKGTLIEVLGTSLIFAGEQEEEENEENEEKEKKVEEQEEKKIKEEKEEKKQTDQSISPSLSSSNIDTNTNSTANINNDTTSTTTITTLNNDKEEKKENTVMNELLSSSLSKKSLTSSTINSNNNNNNLMDTTNTTKISINTSSLPSSSSSTASSITLASSSSTSTTSLSSASSSSSESTIVSNSPIELTENINKSLKSMNFEDTLVRLLATSRKTSMTIPEICKQLKQERENIKDLVQSVECIGCIERKGSTADGSPKEHLYYYKPELDNNMNRRDQLSLLQKGARKCALKDTQYYFKIPPKLPTHRTQKSSNSPDQYSIDGQVKEKNTIVKNNARLSSSLSTSVSTTTAASNSTAIRSKKKRKTKRQGSVNKIDGDDDNNNPLPTTSSSSSMEDIKSTMTSPASSLFTDDDLLEDEFLSSEDECSEKEMSALFQDII